MVHWSLIICGRASMRKPYVRLSHPPLRISPSSPFRHTHRHHHHHHHHHVLLLRISQRKEEEKNQFLLGFPYLRSYHQKICNKEKIVSHILIADGGWVFKKCFGHQIVPLCQWPDCATQSNSPIDKHEDLGGHWFGGRIARLFVSTLISKTKHIGEHSDIGWQRGCCWETHHLFGCLLMLHCEEMVASAELLSLLFPAVRIYTAGELTLEANCKKSRSLWFMYEV